MTHDFDAFLEKIGGFGTYQKKQLFLALAPICFLSCMNIFSSIFLLHSPPTTCELPPNTYSSVPKGVSPKDVSGRMIPWEFNPLSGKMEPSQCQVYDYSDSNWTFPGMGEENWTNKTVDCPAGRWWKTSDWKSTLVTKLDLVCDKGWAVSFLYSVGSFGELAFLPITAYMQDNWGRKPSMFLMLAIYFITSLVLIWVRSWEAVAVLFFIKQGMCHAGFSIAWLIAIESSTSEYHTLMMIVLCIVFSLGSAVSVLVAYFVDTYVNLTLALTIPILGCFAFYPLIDEPARWYLSHFKLDKAREVMSKMMNQNKVNDQSIMEGLLADPGHEMDDKKNGAVRKVTEKEVHPDTGKYGIWHIFSTVNLFVKTMFMFVLCFAIVAIYFGLMMNSEHIGNMYIIQGVGFAVEIPAVLFVQTSNYIGRVWITAGSTLLGGVFCACIVATTTEGLMILFAILSKFWATVAFDVVYMFCGEIYPTVIRGSGVAAGMLGGALGGIAAPYIVFGYNVHPYFPVIMMSMIALVGGFAGLFLPETMGHDMVDRIEEDSELSAGAKSFYENTTFYYARKRLGGRRGRSGNFA